MPMPAFRKAADMQQPAEAPAPAAPATQAKAQPQAGALKTNRFGAKCANCGGWVAAGAGSLTNSGGKWITKHLFAGECAAPMAEPEALFEQNFVKGKPLFDGIYTYETATAHRTFRLKTQALDDSFMPGVQIIQFLSGADNTHDYESFGHVKNGRLSVWKRYADRTTLVQHAQEFMADPHAECVIPAVNCYRCGKNLTVPASVHNGLGPECAKKGM